MGDSPIVSLNFTVILEPEWFIVSSMLVKWSFQPGLPQKSLGESAPQELVYVFTIIESNEDKKKKLFLNETIKQNL